MRSLIIILLLILSNQLNSQTYANIPEKAGDYYWETCLRSDVTSVFDIGGNLARDIQEAKFPDGEYILQIEASDIVNTSTSSPTVNVDNFLPYVQEASLTITFANALSQTYSITLDGSDPANPDIIKITNEATIPLTSLIQSSQLNLTFTEEMSQVNVDFISDRTNQAIRTPKNVVMNQDAMMNPNPKSWMVSFNLPETQSFVFNLGEIRIGGEDLAGNKTWNQNGSWATKPKASVPKKDPLTGNFNLNVNDQADYFFAFDGLHTPSCYDGILNQGEIIHPDFLGPCKKKGPLVQIFNPPSVLDNCRECKLINPNKKNSEEEIGEEDFKWFPNPFSEQLSLSGYNPKEQKILIDLWNSEGQKVRTLLEEVLPQGNVEQTFSLSEQASGLYIVQMIYEDGTSLLYRVIKE